MENKIQKDNNFFLPIGNRIGKTITKDTSKDISKDRIKN
jgi:hypothetical protein